VCVVAAALRSFTIGFCQSTSCQFLRLFRAAGRGIAA